MMNPYRQPLGRQGQGPPPRKDSLPPKPPSILRRKTSEDSLASTDSGSTTRSPSRSTTASPYHGNEAPASSTSTIATSSFRGPRKVSYDLPNRQQSPIMPASNDLTRHRRQHSQGFFEPSLPTTSYTNTPVISSHLTASAIAAQAAMHNQNGLHARRQSQNPPDTINTNLAPGRRKPSGSLPTPISGASSTSSRASSQTRPTLQTTQSAAATAANVAFPRSPVHSPTIPQAERMQSPILLEKDTKPIKERSRMKIFSKPKSSTTSSSKDPEKKQNLTVSPKKSSIYPANTFPRSVNQSMVSLTDSTTASSAASFYTIANASSSTLNPSDRGNNSEKEKHRHHFLSRQRNRHKDGQEQFSSASSNSRATDPNAPALYSFAPSSPGPIASFTKSKTGLDLRHGGRALREKKREEKAAAGTFVPPLAIAAAAAERRENASTPDFGLPSAGSTFGPSSTNAHITELAAGLGVFGLPNMTLDDAWPLLKARLLNIFEGEDIRTPIEDFNKLVQAHLQRCVNQQMPNMIIDDLRELLETGFYSIDQVLRRVPDEKLVLHLVETWRTIFGTVLPFMQAVFLPLDLEFKGRGALLSSKEAREFWGALPVGSTAKQLVSVATLTSTNRGLMKLASLGDVLDVRTFVLVTFRDSIILPRYDTLLSIFSRLSLDSINATPLEAPRSPPPFRPGTAASSSSGAGYTDPIPTSFNSQGSTLLDSSNAGSLGARSRATSNVSAMSSGSFHSVASQRPHASSHGSSNAGGTSSMRSLGPYNRTITTATTSSTSPPDSTNVTQTAARMLQCVSVLAGLQSASSLTGDSATIKEREDEEQDAELVARQKMENLGKALKHNWLGRSRTGRNRRGLVGTRSAPVTAPIVDVVGA